MTTERYKWNTCLQFIFVILERRTSRSHDWRYGFLNKANWGMVLPVLYYEGRKWCLKYCCGMRNPTFKGMAGPTARDVGHQSWKKLFQRAPATSIGFKGFWWFTDLGSLKKPQDCLLPSPHQIFTSTLPACWPVSFSSPWVEVHYCLTLNAGAYSSGCGIRTTSNSR